MSDNIIHDHTDAKSTTEKATAAPTPTPAPKEGFFKRHKNKFKIAGYTTLAGAVLTGGYLTYQYFANKVSQ